NAKETYTLTKRDPERGCDILKNLCDVAVVSMGKEGCWVGEGAEMMRCLAYPVKPIDSTGAGDLFAAGFLHGYLTGQPLPTCADYGAKVAAQVVQVLGAEIPGATWNTIRQELVKS